MRLVIASVQYADMLEVVLPAWTALVPAGLVVATSPDDVDSQRVAASHGVPVAVTTAWTRIDDTCHRSSRPATFNLALALDEVLGLVGSNPPAIGELCGHVSADCVPFGRWPDERTFMDGTVYGFWRYECLSPKALHEHQQGRRSLGQFPKLKNSHSWPIGYNQLFRYAPGIRFGSYATAGKFDTDFSRGFQQRVMRDELYFLHMGPISVKENWAGRVVPIWGAA